VADAKIIGLDPSLRNWGVATGTYNAAKRIVTVDDLFVVQPVVPTGKQVRQSSKDLEAAFQLLEGVLPYANEVNAIFVEVPVGSQNARSMASYGICIGILGAIRALGLPFFEVTPTEVKVTAVNSKTATKRQMIDWATKAHPNAPWPTQVKKGVTSIIESKAEHMADAVGAIHAGIQTPAFQQAVRFMEGAEITH
jgi:Holliday junction resolvasome RuvABC endonuclease subunit